MSEPNEESQSGPETASDPRPPIPLQDNAAAIEKPGSNERSWAVLAHLASIAGWVGIPMGHILAPLLIWVFKKDESEFVREQSIESLNFQVSMTLYAFLAAVLAMTVIGLIVAIPALIAIVIGDIVLTIVGALRVNKGASYLYPWTLRLIPSS
ncbi:MAG: DUF4870 domain-containing protein [Verrucomicrobiota bacterium]